MADTSEDEIRDAAIANHLADQTPAQRRCRRRGHAYEPLGDDNAYDEMTTETGATVWTQTETCIRQCGISKVHYFVPYTLAKYKDPTTHYPPGYLAAGLGRISRHDVRRIEYRRARQQAGRRRRRKAA